MSIEVKANGISKSNCVRIRIDTDTTIRRLQRMVPSGWVDVRMMKDTLPASSLVIEDYEAPIGETVKYKVQADNNPVKYFTARISSQDIVLALPHMPKMSAVLPVLSSYSASRRMPGATDLIIGRDDPLVTILPLQKRQGTVEYTFGSHGEAATVERLYAMGYPLLLRQPCHEHLDLYHVAESTSITPQQTNGSILWKLQVQYVEQNIPGGFLVGTIGWDYAQLTERFRDFVDAESSYRDYGNLLMNIGI